MLVQERQKNREQKQTNSRARLGMLDTFGSNNELQITRFGADQSVKSGIGWEK
jgi:hypothetical protein